MKTIITHSGSFHNDESLAVAIIKMAYPNESFKIIRTRNQEIIEKGKLDDNTFVVDVGLEYIPSMNCFDHHQENCEKHFNEKFERTNSASTGMVWKYFGFDLSGHDGHVYEAVYASLIEEIDRQDNGQPALGRGPQFQVTSFNPTWMDPGSGDDEFVLAVDIATAYLKSAIKNAKGTAAAFAIHEDTMESQTEEGVYVMDTYYPWMTHFVGVDHAYTFVVYPRKDGDWAIQSIPVAPTGFVNKGNLPKSWTEGPVEDMIFCHKALFIASFTTRERAIEMAKEAIALL